MTNILKKAIDFGELLGLEKIEFMFEKEGL